MNPRTMARYSVSMGGQNITSRISSDVHEIRIRRASGATADTAEIVLDDTDGHVVMPRPGAPVSISLGWEGGLFAVVFEGFVDDSPLSTCARGEGRKVTVKAKSADARTKIKQTEEKHEDETTLGDVMQKWAQDAGLSGAKVDSSLASIRRPYWSMSRESFIAWGQRMARENAGTFKIMGSEAVLVKRSGGVSASGRPLATVTAEWGRNLIEWSLTPFRSRPPHQTFEVTWYDRGEAKHKRERVQANVQNVDASSLDRFSMPDQDMAGGRAGSNGVEGERESGGGTVMINGDPSAEPEAACVVVGARPGIDGAYRIDAVEDHYVRDGGYVTTLELKRPEAAADSR